MNIVAFHGSARRGGDTDTLAESLLQGLTETGSHEITRFIPSEMKIAHCRACMQCARGSGCVIDDDMDDVYPALRNADVVILATPMFWGYMTSQLKTLFDRLEAVVCDDYFGNKDFVLLIGYRQYYGSMIEWVDRIARLAGSRSHALAVQTFDPETSRDIPIREQPERLEEAKALGREVARLRAA